MCSTNSWMHKVVIKVNEEDKALLVLITLVDFYDNLVTTLPFGKDTLSLEDIMASLVYNDIRRPNLKGDQCFGLVGWEENCKGMSFVKKSRNNKFR